MTNVQVRMLSLVLALFAGAVLAHSDNIHVNVSLVIILVSSAALVAEYVRSQGGPA